MGCRAEHAEIYYKQTSLLTAFFPFIYLKESKSTAKAITQLASQGTNWHELEQVPHETPTIRETGKGISRWSYPLPNRSPQTYACNTDGQRVQDLRSSFHPQPLGASSGLCICTLARIQ